MSLGIKDTILRLDLLSGIHFIYIEVKIYTRKKKKGGDGCQKYGVKSDSLIPRNFSGKSINKQGGHDKE